MISEATISLNGISLHYELRGEGAPLLLLHGGTGCHSDWAYAGREHFEREYQLVAPDARGHGRSSFGESGNDQQTITHRQCAHDTLALLDHLGIERCTAIGVSMGGNILLHMATLQPDRIYEYLSRLISLDGRLSGLDCLSDGEHPLQYRTIVTAGARVRPAPTLSVPTTYRMPRVAVQTLTR